MRLLIAFVSLLLCGSLQAQVTVVSAASFRPEQPVAPGAWAAAFGTFTGVTATAATDAPFPTSLRRRLRHRRRNGGPGVLHLGGPDQLSDPL